jgi:hypothetical protein
MAVGRALPCVYCGGTHASPADIRACWERTEGVEVEQTEIVEPPPTAAATTTATPTTTPTTEDCG